MDYYNDFQRIVRSYDIESVIERYKEWHGRECLTPEQIRARTDVTAVLDAIYTSSPESHSALIRLAKICASLNPTQFNLLIHILRGGTLTEYAKREGVSCSAVSQRLATMFRRDPLLKSLRGHL